MENKSFKYSLQRDKLLELIRSTNVHPTAEWLYEKLREEIPHLSLGTVYRNLNKLLEQGEINEVVSTQPIRRFDADTDFHYHFICDECKSVYDLEHLMPLNIFNKIRHQIPHDTRRYSVEFFGICENCKENNNR